MKKQCFDISAVRPALVPTKASPTAETSQHCFVATSDIFEVRFLPSPRNHTFDIHIYIYSEKQKDMVFIASLRYHFWKWEHKFNWKQEKNHMRLGRSKRTTATCHVMCSTKWATAVAAQHAVSEKRYHQFSARQKKEKCQHRPRTCCLGPTLAKQRCKPNTDAICEHSCRAHFCLAFHASEQP